MRNIVDTLLLTLITAIVATALTLYAMSAHHNYKITKATYDSQNACIAHWISKGVPRALIFRSGSACNISSDYNQ